MGSQAIQGRLWGQRPKDWAEIQEATCKNCFEFALDHLTVSSATKLLDIGCGTGLFCLLAKDKGVKDITGLDATPEFIEETKKRVHGGSFTIGEMEALPFEDATFNIVCGFNSFQYAADTRHALSEAKRVLKTGGKLVAMIWGDKDDCEAASYLKAIGSLLPPPPPGAPGPFALTENHLLEKMFTELGLKNIQSTDVVSVWDYPDKETALRGLLSAGPAAKAIENSGFEKVYDTTSAALQPYLRPDGHVVYYNKFRVVIAEK